MNKTIKGYMTSRITADVQLKNSMPTKIKTGTIIIVKTLL
ncbi:Uncharacterised protein [Chlamydia trachomatis]|nr:Uncharacterised protein [Chlamydia trachomatis]